MKKSQRLTSKRLDYQVLSDSGEKVYLEVQREQSDESIKGLSQMVKSLSLNDIGMAESTSVSNNLTDLIIKESVLADDITDFLDENPVDSDSTSAEEIDVLIAKMEQFRTSYRTQHKELEFVLKEEYDKKYGKQFTQIVATMKVYIQQLKSVRKIIREKQSMCYEDASRSKERAMSFQVDEILRSFAEMESIFDCTMKSETDGNIKGRHDDLPHIMNSMGGLSDKIKCLMETSPCSKSAEGLIEKIKKRYDSLIDLKSRYSSLLVAEMANREIIKQESFNSSMLNINLGKYSGYACAQDIYSFQTAFEKLFLKSTPRSHLAELLKNNYLSDPALLLVKHVDDIDEVWKRLKAAYGDQKILLNKKLGNIRDLNVLWKYKEPEKVIDGLVKIINIMKDLIRLAKEHKIENSLFYGDG